MALISLGTSPIHYFNKSAVSETVDLNTFRLLGTPFDTHNTCQHACVSNLGLYLAVSNSGLAATSSDLINWNTYDLQNRSLQFMKVTHNDQFVAVGFQKNSDLSETAQVWSSTNAFDGFSWTARFAQNSSSSVFRDVCTLSGVNLVTVGGSDHTGPVTSLLVTGTATGAWDPIPLPEDLQGGLYSVAYDLAQNRIWVGGLGWIATADWQQAQTTWTKTVLVDAPIAVQNILFVNNQVICTIRDHVFVSDNLFDYTSIPVPGHAFTAITHYNNQIILGTHSLLTEHTAFVLDTQTLSVTGLQTQVSANAFIIS